MAFAKMSLDGFGGVLVWARRGIVDPLPLDDSGRFNFALCHFLREPNIVSCPLCSARASAALPGVLPPLLDCSRRPCRS